MTWLWILCIAIGLIAFFFLFLQLIGSRLPREHVVSASVRFNQPADKVYAAIHDVANWPMWDPGVDKVERLADTDGRETVKMTMGRNVFVLVTSRHEPPRVLERTMTDNANIFGGLWRHEVTPEGGGCSLKLIEEGWINPAIPRAMIRLKFFDPAMYLKRHLRRLGAKFGESVVVSG